VSLREVLSFVGSCVLVRRFSLVRLPRGRAGDAPSSSSSSLAHLLVRGGMAVRRSLCTSISSKAEEISGADLGASGSIGNSVSGPAESDGASARKKSPIYTRTGDRGTSMASDCAFHLTQKV
jgi:hypothetical protein